MMRFVQGSAAATIAMAAAQFASAQFLEGFEHGNWLDNYTHLSGSSAPIPLEPAAARSGSLGARFSASGWWMNSNLEATVNDGETWEYWVRGTSGRAYIGFTTNDMATIAYTVVAASNTSDLLIQDNSDFSFGLLAQSEPIAWSGSDFYQVVVRYDDGVITAEAFTPGGLSLAPPIQADTGHLEGGLMLVRGFSDIQVDDIRFGGTGACFADCDASGELDFFDFLCFQNEFAARTAYADCDESGEHDFFDFLCFQNEFSMGCP